MSDKYFKALVNTAHEEADRFVEDIYLIYRETVRDSQTERRDRESDIRTER